MYICIQFLYFNDVGLRSLILGVSPGSKHCTTILNIAKHFKTVPVRLWLFFQFT